MSKIKEFCCKKYSLQMDWFYLVIWNFFCLFFSCHFVVVFFGGGVGCPTVTSFTSSFSFLFFLIQIGIIKFLCSCQMVQFALTISKIAMFMILCAASLHVYSALYFDSKLLLSLACKISDHCCINMPFSVVYYLVFSCYLNLCF